MEKVTVTLPKTPEEAKAERVEAKLAVFDHAAITAATAINDANAEFWSGTDEETVAFLNYLGIPKVLSLFDEHRNKCEHINAILQARDIHSVSALIGSLKPVDVDPNTGKFVVVWPPTPEIPVDPEQPV